MNKQRNSSQTHIPKTAHTATQTSADVCGCVAPAGGSVAPASSGVAPAAGGVAPAGGGKPPSSPAPTRDGPLASPSIVDYESALELTGTGVFNYLALLSCTSIFMYSLVEMIGLAYVVDPMECDLKLDVMQKTLVGSAIFFGIMLSSVCWGILGDAYGRKKVMLPAIFATILSSAISSMCTVFWSMFLMRLITGALVAASSATILVYLGELNSAEHRDTAISYAITAVSVGFVALPAIAWAIVPGYWSFNMLGLEVKPWRVFMWTFSFTGFLGAIVMIFLPESPSFVLAHNGEIATVPILAKMWHYNHLKDKTHIFPVQHIINSPHHEAGDSIVKNMLRDLLQLVRFPMRRPFLITHYCMFMVFLLANGVYLWMPGIFNLVLQDTKLPWTVCKALQSRYTSHSEEDFVLCPHAGGGGMDCDSGSINTLMYPMAIIMELTLVVPFLIITVVIEKFNKCLLYVGVMTPCALGLATCVLVPQVVVAACLMTIGICSGSAATILTALAVEAFPTSLRALVMCTMYMFGQVGAVLGNTLVGIAAKGSCEVVFFFIAVLTAGSIASLVFCWPKITEVRTIMESRNYIY